MKYITVKLTEEQALSTVQAVEWSQDFDNAGQSRRNAFLQRIINKIEKQLNS